MAKFKDMYKEIKKENCLGNHIYTTFGAKIMNSQWSWISSPLIFSSQHINFDRVNILSKALKGNHFLEGNHTISDFIWRLTFYCLTCKFWNRGHHLNWSYNHLKLPGSSNHTQSNHNICTHFEGKYLLFGVTT